MGVKVHDGNSGGGVEFHGRVRVRGSDRKINRREGGVSYWRAGGEGCGFRAAMSWWGRFRNG